MTQLNGINYTEALLTDEELAVVWLMREGAKIEARFHEIEYDKALRNIDIVPVGSLTDVKYIDFSEESDQFFLLEAANKKNTVRLINYIDA